MTTIAHSLTTEFAHKWDGALPSAVLSGIVGDGQHAARGGYHISIQDQPSSNYSVTRVDDKAPPGNWPRNLAAAVDMSMSPADMITTYNCVVAVWSNSNDPRRKYVNCVNCYSGSGQPARLDFVTGGRSIASSDHSWHNHLEIRRRYVTDPVAYDAIFSMVSGESLDAYNGRHGQTKGVDMTTAALIQDAKGNHYWTDMVATIRPVSTSGRGEVDEFWMYMGKSGPQYAADIRCKNFNPSKEPYGAPLDAPSYEDCVARGFIDLSKIGHGPTQPVPPAGAVAVGDSVTMKITAIEPQE